MNEDQDLKNVLGFLKYLASCIVVVLLAYALVGCGSTHKVKGGTQSDINVAGDVYTEAVVKVVLRIDLTDCADLPAADKIRCIEAITGVFEALGDLSKLLICPPDVTECQSLDDILSAVKGDEDDNK